MSNAAPLSCRHAVPDDVPDIVFSIGRAEWQSVNKALQATKYACARLRDHQTGKGAQLCSTSLDNWEARGSESLESIEESIAVAGKVLQCWWTDVYGEGGQRSTKKLIKKAKRTEKLVR